MALTELNGISIAEIAVYVPALCIGIFLSVRHGFRRSAGWLYLIIFALARIIGASLQLATISDPSNLRLYIGAATLQNIGLSPLILTQLALVNRALESVRRSRETFLNPHQLRVVQLVVLVGLILGIVGGSDSGTTYADTGVYAPSALSQAGIGLMIAGYVLLVIATVAVATQISHAEAGEKRLVLAVGLSLPFILVRLAYSGESTFADNPDFNQVTGNPNVLLGMAVIMEMIVVIIVESIGLTLKKVPKSVVAPAAAAAAARPAGFGGRRRRAREQRGGYQMQDYQRPSRV